jgi:hypothetical protein
VRAALKESITVRAEKTVLVLGADYSPLHHVSKNHAFMLLFRGVAVMHEEHPTEKFGKFPAPIQMRLVCYIPGRWYYESKMKYSKSAVLIRDNWRCAYCSGSAATIDHVIPKCRGGRDTFENTVACCKRCNLKKGSSLLSEMGWTLKFKPCQPRRDQMARNRRVSNSEQ